MSANEYETNNSIIETSLAELAFALFFVTLIFSVFKINEARSEKALLEDEVVILEESLTEATKAFENIEDFDPNELFKELTIGKKAQEELKQTRKEKSALAERVKYFEDIEKQLNSSPKEVAEKLKQLETLKEALALNESKEDPVSKVKDLMQQNSDIKGQNINLRTKLSKVGNGLDHPPCWADPVTGQIQYAFNVVISETSTEFMPGWSESRRDQALGDSHIMAVIGSYSTNKSMWSASQALYEDSVDQECRHFVRVYDHAESKSSFKRFLLGIENHFYKYLSNEKYDVSTRS